MEIAVRKGGREAESEKAEEEEMEIEIEMEIEMQIAIERGKDIEIEIEVLKKKVGVVVMFVILWKTENIQVIEEDEEGVVVDEVEGADISKMIFIG